MLGTIDLDKSLTKEEYVRDLIRYQLQLRALAYQLYVQKRPLVIVYEGWDAGGKGGNIKRITEKLDPRGYEVYPIAAPHGEDKTHHYLYRFWRRIKPPDEKQILFFDRSWYGRVMVERLEGFCTEEEWKRAYGRSTSSSVSWSTLAPYWPSSGSISAKRSNCAASKGVRRRPTRLGS